MSKYTVEKKAVLGQFCFYFAFFENQNSNVNIYICSHLEFFINTVKSLS